MKTTLNQIREHSPCASGWGKLLRSLNKTTPDDEPLDIAYIVRSNGLDDALWCLRTVQGHDKEVRLFTIWCARQVQHLMKDQRSIAALDVAERFANGEATQGELDAAANAAARAAENAASDAAAWAAANAASDAAAGAAANATANAAARAAANAAARGAQTDKLLELCGVDHAS